MTREEADNLQRLLDAYVKLRDEPRPVEAQKARSSSRRTRVPPRISANPRLTAAYKKLKEKVGSKPLQDFRVFACKMNLAATVEPLVPEVRLVEGGVDLLGLATAFASVFGVDIAAKPRWISVVDGYEDADPEEIGRKEFQRLYSIKVPGDVVEGAMLLRSNKVMYGLATERMKGAPDVSDDDLPG